MKKENSILMREARESLKGKWALAIGACVIYMIITCGVSGIHFSGPIFSLIISGPMTLGLTTFSLSLSRNKEIKISQLFEGFNRFEVSLKAYLLMTLYIILWTLLLIVPGIIATISYSQTFYILADNNSISATEALKKSKEMMYGNKWKYFRLMFRFFGWFLLSILTLGIGFFWLAPYMQVTFAKFYQDIAKPTEVLPAN